MKRLVRLSLLIVPLGIGLLARAPAGDAGVVIPSRFVNPDTTLLRDTLNIKFDRIFVLADSLRCTPDTLRALAVRYGFTLERLVFLVDSMHVREADRLGERIEDARGRLLAVAGQQGTTFVYSSSYNTQQTSSSWSNTLDYQWVQGARVVRNKTSVGITRLTGGSRETRQQRRDTEMSLGWLLSPRLSIGGRYRIRSSANIDRSIYAFSEDNSDLQFSLETHHEPLPGLSLELNLFEGVTEQDRGTSGRRGYLGEVNGRARYERGEWLAWDLYGLLTGNHSRTRTLDMPFYTTDLLNRFNGSLALFQAAPVSLRIEYSYDNPHNEQVPQAELVYVLPVVSRNRNLGGTLRVQKSSDTYLDVEGRISDQQASVVTGAGSVNVPDDVRFGNDRSASASGNTIVLGWSVNSRLSYSRGVDLTPRVRQDAGRYRERATTVSRGFETTVSRTLTPRISARFTGSVSLDSYDYGVTSPRVEATPTRDSPRQSWRSEATYTASPNVRSTVILEVSRWQDLNLSGRNSASNTETRNYRGEWQWTARITPGLTANQRNSIAAGYSRQLFNPALNRLQMDYSTVTTLNAVVTPKLSVDLNHNAGYQPSGSYRRSQSGIEAFSPSSEGRTYLLSSNIRYIASPAITLTLGPSYYYRSNAGRASGMTSLQRADRSLKLSGRADINIPVGRTGRLTGGISREFNDGSTTEYSGGLPSNQRPTETDFWVGTLQFSWKL